MGPPESRAGQDRCAGFGLCVTSRAIPGRAQGRALVLVFTLGSPPHLQRVPCPGREQDTVRRAGGDRNLSRRRLHFPVHDAGNSRATSPWLTLGARGAGLSPVCMRPLPLQPPRPCPAGAGPPPYGQTLALWSPSTNVWNACPRWTLREGVDLGPRAGALPGEGETLLPGVSPPACGPQSREQLLSTCLNVHTHTCVHALSRFLGKTRGDARHLLVAPTCVRRVDAEGIAGPTLSSGWREGGREHVTVKMC